MEFHSPTLKDHNWVQDAFDFGQTDCCEYCFGNIFMWSDIYDNKICNDNGIFVSADFTDEPVFCYPIGKGDKKATIQKLIEYSKKLGVALEFFGMTEKDRDELQFLFPHQFEITETRDFFDYVYKSEELSNLVGRKFHSKKKKVLKEQEKDGRFKVKVMDSNLNNSQNRKQKRKVKTVINAF